MIKNNKKTALIVLPIILFLLGGFLFAYSSAIDVERRNVEKEILSIGLASFHSEVMTIFEKYRPSTEGTPDEQDRTVIELTEGRDVITIASSDWTKAINRLSPLRVWAVHNGIFIQVLQGPVLAEGLFVAAGPLNFTPSSEANGLEKISSNIYWFQQVSQ